MDGQGEKFEAKLPARITGLVFWGLVFIGLLVAVIILSKMEASLITSKKQESLVIAYDVENILEQYAETPALVKAAGKIRSRINEHIIDFDINAVRLHESDESLSIGSVHSDDDIYKYSLHYYPSDSNKLHVVEIEIYSTNAKKSVADLRKQILLSIGIETFSSNGRDCGKIFTR